MAVYIHGGAFQNGSNRDRSGKQIIRDHSFIYVSINYRLGVLGYLYLGAALGEEYRGTGKQRDPGSAGGPAPRVYGALVRLRDLEARMETEAGRSRQRWRREERHHGSSRDLRV